MDREVPAHGEMDREVLARGETDRDLAGRTVPAPERRAGHAGTPAGSEARDRSAPQASRPRGRSPLALVRDGLRRLSPARRTLRSAREATDIDRAMRFAMSVTKRRAVCFVVSDFLDEGFERALLAANQKHDVIAVLVTDRRELEIPDAGLIALRDAETGRTVLHDTGSAAFRRHAEAAARDRVADLEKRLRRSGIDFIHIDAAGSVVDPIVRFFRMRERRKRR